MAVFLDSTVSKSDEKAIKFREAGNFYFVKKIFLGALIGYNKSISFASTKHALSLGYANRSAVYLELEYFDECLKNIEWARENGYPADKLSKLDDREQKCNELKLKGSSKKKQDPWEFFKLSYPPNKKIPWIVDRLEVRTTEKYGRGIYATQDLEAGDIICIEDAVIHFLHGDGLYKHCSHCFKTCMLNLIPCNKTASMMFCSTECRDDFYVCFICDEKELVHPEIKMISKLAFSFGGYKMLDDYITSATDIDLKKTIFDFYLNNKDDPEYDLSLAICFLSLTSIFDSRMSEDRIYKFISKKAANHILGIFNINNFVCAYGSGDGRLPVRDGSRVSLFRGLINHNCVSNINAYYIDNKEVIFVMNPIKAGEQLVYCYHDKYAPDHELRKKKMMETCRFKCDCDECLNNNHKFKLSNTINPEMFMSRYDFTEARKILKKGWKIVNKNNKSKKVVNDSRLHNLQIMYALAYYGTFPC